MLPAQSKLVLVEDDAQLPPVPAGTTCADVFDAQPAPLTLETPNRFATPSGEPDYAEARALSYLRSGTLEGTASYRGHKQRTGTVEALHPAAALDAATAWRAEQATARTYARFTRSGRARTHAFKDEPSCSETDERDSDARLSDSRTPPR